MFLHILLVVYSLASVLTLSLIGCGAADTSGGGSMGQAAAQLEAQDAAQQQETPADADEPAATADPAQPAEPQRTEAGRAPVGEGGYFVAIAGARRHVLNRVDDLAWTQAVQHFQAEHGRLPKDHEEFMSKIVERLEIDLGYKEENQEFLYDPSEGPYGTLYVVEKEEAPAGP